MPFGLGQIDASGLSHSNGLCCRSSAIQITLLTHGIAIWQTSGSSTRVGYTGLIKLWEIQRRLNLKGDDVPSELEDFIDRHVGPDRQLTLRLAS